MSSNYFYKNIKYLRGNKSITKFANELGYSASTFARWESNQNGATLDSIIDISEKLDIPLTDLVGKDLKLIENVQLDEDTTIVKAITKGAEELSPESKKALLDIANVLREKDKK